MRNTKSYMVPKLICVNMLALMMFTFEHKITADDHLLLKPAKVKAPVPVSQGGLMQVSVNQPVNEPPQAATVEKPVQIKKTAVYKKRMHHSRVMMNTQPMLIKAGYISNSPVDCCFRGNRI